MTELCPHVMFIIKYYRLSSLSSTRNDSNSAASWDEGSCVGAVLPSLGYSSAVKIIIALNGQIVRI